MPTPFARSMRSLELDDFRSTLVFLFVGALLFFGWLAWFLFAELPLYAMTNVTTLEIVREPPAAPGTVLLVAELASGQGLGNVIPSQHALFHPAGSASRYSDAVSATVTRIGPETPSGKLRVELKVEYPEKLPPIPQPELSGTLEIEVGRVSPAQLVLRSVGRVLSGSDQEDNAAR